MIERWIILILTIGAAFSLFPDKLTLDNSDKYMDYLDTLLSITTKKGGPRRVRIFIAISIVTGLVSFSLLITRLELTLSILALLISTTIPFFILRIRLDKIQVDSSREGEILITELLNNYRIYFFNMREAIERTALTIEDAPNSKRLLFNLSKGLQVAGSDEEIRKLLYEFKLSLNTTWGNILVTNMDFSLTSGIKVNDAISELIESIKKARKLEEYSKRENNESKLMLWYLAPFLYILTVICAIFYFGMSVREYIYYQFETEAGLSWLMISIMSYVMGIMCQKLLLKTKLDF